MKKLLSIIMSVSFVFNISVVSYARPKEVKTTNFVDILVSDEEVNIISEENLETNKKYVYKIGDTIESAVVEVVDNGTKYTFEDINTGKKNEVLADLNGDLYIDGSILKIEDVELDNLSDDILDNTNRRAVDNSWFFSKSPYVSGAYNSNSTTSYKSLTTDRTFANLTVSAMCMAIATVLSGGNVGVGITVGSSAFTGAEVIIKYYENNNPNAKQCWMKYIRTSNDRVDTNADGTTYYYAFNNYYYSDSSRSNLISNDYSYAKLVRSYN